VSCLKQCHWQTALKPVALFITCPNLDKKADYFRYPLLLRTQGTTKQAYFLCKTINALFTLPEEEKQVQACKAFFSLA
jgi:hypothetical protein